MLRNSGGNNPLFCPFEVLDVEGVVKCRPRHRCGSQVRDDIVVTPHLSAVVVFPFDYAADGIVSDNVECPV